MVEYSIHTLFFTNNSLAVRNAHFKMLDGSGERLFGFQAVFTIFAGRRETICLEGKRGRAIYISIFKTMREKDMRVLVFKIPSIFNWGNCVGNLKVLFVFFFLLSWRGCNQVRNCIGLLFYWKGKSWYHKYYNIFKFDYFLNFSLTPNRVRQLLSLLHHQIETFPVISLAEFSQNFRIKPWELGPIMDRHKQTPADVVPRQTPKSRQMFFVCSGYGDWILGSEFWVLWIWLGS